MEPFKSNGNDIFILKEVLEEPSTKFNIWYNPAINANPDYQLSVTGGAKTIKKYVVHVPIKEETFENFCKNPKFILDDGRVFSDEKAFSECLKSEKGSVLKSKNDAKTRQGDQVYKILPGPPANKLPEDDMYKKYKGKRAWIEYIEAQQPNLNTHIRAIPSLQNYYAQLSLQMLDSIFHKSLGLSNEHVQLLRGALNPVQKAEIQKFVNFADITGNWGSPGVGNWVSPDVLIDKTLQRFFQEGKKERKYVESMSSVGGILSLKDNVKFLCPIHYGGTSGSKYAEFLVWIKDETAAADGGITELPKNPYITKILDNYKDHLKVIAQEIIRMDDSSDITETFDKIKSPEEMEQENIESFQYSNYNFGKGHLAYLKIQFISVAQRKKFIEHMNDYNKKQENKEEILKKKFRFQAQTTVCADIYPPSSSSGDSSSGDSSSGDSSSGDSSSSSVSSSSVSSSSSFLQLKIGDTLTNWFFYNYTKELFFFKKLFEIIDYFHDIFGDRTSIGIKSETYSFRNITLQAEWSKYLGFLWPMKIFNSFGKDKYKLEVVLEEEKIELDFLNNEWEKYFKKRSSLPHTYSEVLFNSLVEKTIKLIKIKDNSTTVKYDTPRKNFLRIISNSLGNNKKLLENKMDGGYLPNKIKNIRESGGIISFENIRPSKSKHMAESYAYPFKSLLFGDVDKGPRKGGALSNEQQIAYKNQYYPDPNSPERSQQQMVVKDSAAAPTYFLTSLFGVEKLESLQKDGISSIIDASTAKGSEPKTGSIYHDYNLDCVKSFNELLKDYNDYLKYLSEKSSSVVVGEGVSSASRHADGGEEKAGVVASDPDFQKIVKKCRGAIPCNTMPYDYLRDPDGNLNGIVFVIYTPEEYTGKNIEDEEEKDESGGDEGGGGWEWGWPEAGGGGSNIFGNI